MQNSTTDNSNSSATLGTVNPEAKMQSHLTPATPEAKTVVAQVPPPIAQNVDAKTIEGSHSGDHRGQAAQPDPLKGNENPVRSETETVGA